MKRIARKLRRVVWKLLGSDPTSVKRPVDASSSLGYKTYVSTEAQVGSSTVGSNCVVEDRVRVADSVVGDCVHLEHNVSIFGSEIADYVRVQRYSELINVRLASYTYTSRNTFMINTSVGKFTSIGPNTCCGAGDHPSHWIATTPVFYSPLVQCGMSVAKEDHFGELRPVQIGNDCWIGANVYIKNGVVIGDGAIVAAGAIVTCNVAPYSVVGGIPARVLRMRFDDDSIQKLLRLRWWEWSADELEQGAEKFRSSDIHAFLDWVALYRGDRCP